MAHDHALLSGVGMRPVNLILWGSQAMMCTNQYINVLVRVVSLSLTLLRVPHMTTAKSENNLASSNARYQKWDFLMNKCNYNEITPK